jgi:hypothetical protein
MEVCCVGQQASIISIPNSRSIVSQPANSAIKYSSSKTIANADRPEIKLKQILQNPRVRKDTPHVISGLVPTGNKDSPKNTGPTKAVTSIITSMIYKNVPVTYLRLRTTRRSPKR